MKARFFPNNFTIGDRISIDAAIKEYENRDARHKVRRIRVKSMWHKVLYGPNIAQFEGEFRKVEGFSIYIDVPDNLDVPDVVRGQYKLFCDGYKFDLRSSNRKTIAEFVNDRLFELPIVVAFVPTFGERTKTLIRYEILYGNGEVVPETHYNMTLKELRQSYPDNYRAKYPGIITRKPSLDVPDLCQCCNAPINKAENNQKLGISRVLCKKCDNMTIEFIDVTIMEEYERWMALAKKIKETGSN